ncbi:glycosyltransferase family 4 protein [bacterium]|nr:glycosyltransferase family 4 protein [bacterium]
MKILAVCTLPPHRGGSAVSSALLLRGFAAAGHAVRVLAPIADDAAGGADAFAAAHPEIAVTRFPVPFDDVAPNLPTADRYRSVERESIRARLPELIAADRPDLVFMGRETFAWDVPEIARAHGIPAVLRTAGAMTIGMLHGTLPAADIHHLFSQYRKAALIICPARHLAARLAPFDVGTVRVIWNAVDADRFAPRVRDPRLARTLRLRADHVVVAHVSNLKSLKRPLDVIDAAALALRRDPRLVFVIVGQGPVGAAMRAACDEKGIAERVRFVGWVDHDRVADFLNLSDIVVMPAEDETQARVYLETQSCGRVLLASDIAAAREVVTDGETGVLFRKGDPADLAARLLHLADRPALRAAIGRQARARVTAHALPTIVAEYLDAFAGVVSAASPSLPPQP